jgi:hypothetical protein
MTTQLAETVAQPAAQTAVVRSRSWWQFSLLSLLLLLVAGCAVAAWIGELRRRETAERELVELQAKMRALRNAVGITDDQPDVLTITDDKLVHVRALYPLDELSWRWRIYLPPGKQWSVYYSHGEKWDDARGVFEGGGGSSGISCDGEFTLEATIVRRLNGRPYLSYRAWKSGGATLLPEEGLRALASNGTVLWEATGSAKQATFDNGGHIPLLRFQRMLGIGSSLGEARQSPDNLGSMEGLPEYGISIALLEYTNGPPPPPQLPLGASP